MTAENKRNFYYPKKGIKLDLPVGLNETDCEVHTYISDQKICAVGFIGKSAKPAFRYNFKTFEKRDEYILQFYLKVFKLKNTKKEKAKYTNKLQVGDILYSSWGYEQTSIDFYQVVESKGMFVTLREIKGKDVNIISWASSEIIAVKDAFTKKEAFKKKVIYPGNIVKIDSTVWAMIYDGKPLIYTSRHQ